MKKILVVDNHPIMLKYMAGLLEKKGYRVITAEDGLSALEILEDYLPDIIFVDLVMPNIDGRKLCRIIRGLPKLKDVYLIILSAIAAEDDLDCIELGVDACIAKAPFNKMEKHILTALNRLGSGSSYHMPRKTIGLEDIHARTITQELLADKKHFEVILASMSEGILEITHEAKVVYANPAALSTIGIPEVEFLASNFTDLFAEKDRKRVEHMLVNMRNISQTNTPDSLVPMKNKRVELKFLPLEREGHRSIVMLNDVTEQKRNEAQLQQAQKMEAIGTLAAGIAHDFNNLLMGIQGYASLMLLQTHSTHPHYKMLRGIEKQVQSGSKLTKQLLGYGRKGKYELKLNDFNELVEETSDTFGRTKKEITIHRKLSPDLLKVKVDHSQLKQVLLNIYVNAADTMPDGGDLFLKTTSTSHKEMDGKLYDPTPGDYVLLEITDTGTGMDEKTRERIFEPFFTTKGMGRGTGLGLASAYGIVKGHNGYIDVKSEKGRGTTFRIYLPATETDIKEVGIDKRKEEKVATDNKTILLVDDEDTIREVGQDMLETIGYQVMTAADGKEAVEIYKENHGNIDIILMDMVMPNMGGGKAYDHLKEIDPGINVILSSGYSIDGEASEILDRGCNGFIQKPFTINDLTKKIEEVLNI